MRKIYRKFIDFLGDHPLIALIFYCLLVAISLYLWVRYIDPFIWRFVRFWVAALNILFVMGLPFPVTILVFIDDILQALGLPGLEELYDDIHRLFQSFWDWLRGKKS